MGRQAENESLDPTAEDLCAAALNVACESLLELELIRAMAIDDRRLHEHLGRAITLLRLAVIELRLVRAPHANPLAYGFVMAGPRARGRSRIGAPQSSP